jgi:predicted metal-dependent enzyme (double-stranded beta helix superfamily)
MKFTLDRFIEDVKLARREGDGRAAVQEVIARAVSDPAAVLDELGEPAEGGIHTLYHDDAVSIFNVIWTPRMMLVPHDHLMWVSIGIYTGREDNILWERKDPTITASAAASLSTKDVFSLPDTAIHSVNNPIDKLTGAIHIYGGDLTTKADRSQWNAETLLPQPFDFEGTRQVFAEANARLRNTG